MHLVCKLLNEQQTYALGAILVGILVTVIPNSIALQGRGSQQKTLQTGIITGIICGMHAEWVVLCERACSAF